MVKSYCSSPFLKQCGDRSFKCERRGYGIVDKDGILYVASAKDRRCFLSVVLQYTCMDPLLLPGNFCAKSFVTSDHARFCSSLSFTNKESPSTDHRKPFLVQGVCCASTSSVFEPGWSQSYATSESWLEMHLDTVASVIKGVGIQ